MIRTKVKIHIQSASLSPDGSVIVLSETIARKRKIPTGQIIHLRYGSGRQDVKVMTTATPGVMRVSESLASRWGLAGGQQLCLSYRSASRSLHIGPLIGVMVSRVSSRHSDRPFGASTAFCHELTDACRQYGAAVFFCTPNDLNGSSDTVTGWHYVGRWERATFPVPHVVYNRLTSRRYENQPNVQHFMNNAKAKHRATVFNEKYLNKTEVFDALRKESGLHSYLPESHLLRSFQTLQSMCSRYSTVFLKPITGSLGKGIIRVRREAGGTYTCHYTSLNGVRKVTYPKLASLFSSISGKMKSQRYQIQQGLHLINAGGRPVDFRALVQRGETGQWDVTSIVGRIAGSKHFVSNLARGGSLSPVKEALSRAGASPTGSARLKRAALQIAKGIEAQVPGHFAELGIDLALDTSGRVWLLEVNSKPSKDDNTPLSTERKIRPSVITIVKYARFAAKL